VIRPPSSAVLLLAAAAAACGGAREESPSPAPPEPAPAMAPSAALRLLPLGAPPVAGEGVVARVEIAATPEARERGLMGRADLPRDTGMLFVYPGDRELAFWMKDCPVALDAAYLDGEGRILNVHSMAPAVGVPDGDLPRYPSAGPARYVLEMESGWFARRGLGKGDRADLREALRGVVAR
jgi:uncharacterized membrane protein (UPF0127 family)